MEFNFLTVICLLVIVCLGSSLWIVISDLKVISRQFYYIVKEESNLYIASTSRLKAVRELNEELNAFIRYYQGERARYVQLDKHFKQAITNVSHDIRTPLTSIHGYMQMLEEETLDVNDRKTYLAIVNQRMLYLKTLLEELFYYTKIINIEYEMKHEKVCLYPLLCDCILAFYKEFEQAQMQVEIQFDQEDVTLYGDKDAWNRIFHNLILNTLRHGHRCFQIRQVASEDNVIISFENNIKAGVSVDAEAMFDRFYKGDSSRKEQSSGLGLAIVKELIEQMSGGVRAHIIEDQLIVCIEMDK